MLFGTDFVKWNAMYIMNAVGSYEPYSKSKLWYKFLDAKLVAHGFWMKSNIIYDIAVKYSCYAAFWLIFSDILEEPGEL